MIFNTIYHRKKSFAPFHYDLSLLWDANEEENFPSCSLFIVIVGMDVWVENIQCVLSHKQCALKGEQFSIETFNQQTKQHATRKISARPVGKQNARKRKEIEHRTADDGMKWE